MEMIIELLERNKLYRYLVIVMVLYVMVGVVYATDDQPVPNTFSSGNVASSSEVNANFDWLVDRSWDLDDTSGTDIYYNVTDGNVGIGTDEPDFKLDVDGGSSTAIHAQSSDGNTIDATSTAGGGYAVIHSSTTTGGTYGVWSSSTQYVGGRFESNSGNALEAYTDTGNAGIFMGGDVGIGTTSPGRILDVDGQITLRPGSLPNAGIWLTDASDTDEWYMGKTNAAGKNQIGFWKSDWRMVVEADGDVGIGTTDPEADLHLDNSGANTLRINNYHDGYMEFYSQSTSTSPILAYFRVKPHSSSSAITVMTLRETGNVGIGTISPKGRLDVNGSIYQRGSVLHADYVFEPDYDLESIEEHAENMWKNKRLKAIPEAEKDENGMEIIDVGSHRRGIVEELEKAHIYIEQLHKHIKAFEERLAKLESRSNNGQ